MYRHSGNRLQPRKYPGMARSRAVRHTKRDLSPRLAQRGHSTSLTCQFGAGASVRSWHSTQRVAAGTASSRSGGMRRPQPAQGRTGISTVAPGPGVASPTGSGINRNPAARGTPRRNAPVQSLSATDFVCRGHGRSCSGRATVSGRTRRSLPWLRPLRNRSMASDKLSRWRALNTRGDQALRCSGPFG